MNKIILSILIWIIGTNLYSQRIGEWNTHFSYESNITSVAQADSKIFAVSDGKLFSYDSEDESIESYSKINADDITNIAYCKKQGCLIIVRSNGDIDLLYPNGDYANIPDLKNVTDNIDKKVNDIYVWENLAYLSTNFGLMVLNLERVEVKESLIVRYPFYSTCIFNGHLYSATSNGTKFIDPNDNIQDITRWTGITLSSKFSDSSFNDVDIRKVDVFDEYLVFTVPNVGFYKYKDDVVSKVAAVNYIQGMSQNGSKLVVRGTNSFAEFETLQTGAAYKYFSVSTLCLIQDKDKSNVYWGGVSSKNLVSFKVGDSNNSYEMLSENLRPSGPLSNYPYFLSYENDKLLFTGGRAQYNNFGIVGRWGELNKDGSWSNCNIQDFNTATGKGIQDVVSFRYDPYDPNHAFVCSWNEGLLEINNKTLTKLYDDTNSPLNRVEAWTIKLRVNGGIFDKDGNYWFLNSASDEPVKVIKKGTSTVISVAYPTLMQRITNMKSIVIDRYNYKWVTTVGGTPYLAVFDNNGTIDNINDDKIKYVDKFYSQDGDLLSFSDLFDLVEDKTGNLWLGTNNGIYIIYNNRDIFNKDITLNKIKIPRNDGTNTADILLEDIPVRSIVVDGANRKWLGTLSGVYVVSANGQETIHHFSMENSLLPSNSVVSMAMNHETGVIYIGTEKGIVSYKNEAIEGAESYSNVYAYPNPVKPDYEGPITVTGLKTNSTVKITDVKGNLINEGKSTGGQYIWDGRNVNRDRVETGIYLVFGSSEDGKDGVVSKIMVITN